MALNAFRAYLHIDDSNAPELSNIVLNIDGDDAQTGIAHTDFTDGTDRAGAWYDLQGRKIANSQKLKACIS